MEEMEGMKRGSGNPFNEIVKRISNVFVAVIKGVGRKEIGVGKSEVQEQGTGVIGAGHGFVHHGFEVEDVFHITESAHSDTFCNSSNSDNLQSTQNTHNSNHHNHPNHTNAYQFSPHFEKVVEIINTVAGLIVVLAVCLAGVNFMLAVLNANIGRWCVCVYMYACMYTCIKTYLHACMYRHIHTYILSHIYRYACCLQYTSVVSVIRCIYFPV